MPDFDFQVEIDGDLMLSSIVSPGTTQFTQNRQTAPKRSRRVALRI